MREGWRAVLAFAAAVLAPSALPLVPYVFDLVANDVALADPAWIRFERLAVLVLATASLGVVILGVPTFLLMRWRKKAIRWWSASLIGFALGCLPQLLELPIDLDRRGSSSHWNGQRMVFTEIDGMPTLEGWAAYLQQVIVFGAFGAVAGLAFWAVWRGLGSRERVRATNDSSRA